MKHKIVVGITGASGAVYAKLLLNKLQQLGEQIEEVGVVMSDNAKEVWKYELGNSEYDNLSAPKESGVLRTGKAGIPFHFYKKDDFFAPFASGSAMYNTMIICPCSMGTMARIASGISNDLISRAADVILKERRKLILVLRDTPFHLIHINNMKAVTEAGGIICPASPSFYSKPASIEQLASTVVDRVIDLAGLEQKSFRWNEK